MEEVKFRYWVSLSASPDSVSGESESFDDIAGDILNAINYVEEIERNFDVSYNEDMMVFKTRDFEEAKKVAGEAWDIYVKYFPDEDDPDVSGIEIAAQPRCEKCDYDGRFSEGDCPNCGEPLEHFPTHMLTDLFPDKDPEE